MQSFEKCLLSCHYREPCGSYRTAVPFDSPMQNYNKLYSKCRVNNGHNSNTETKTNDSGTYTTLECATQLLL